MSASRVSPPMPTSCLKHTNLETFESGEVGLFIVRQATSEMQIVRRIPDVVNGIVAWQHGH